MPVDIWTCVSSEWNCSFVHMPPIMNLRTSAPLTGSPLITDKPTQSYLYPSPLTKNKTFYCSNYTNIKNGFVNCSWMVNELQLKSFKYSNTLHECWVSWIHFMKLEFHTPHHSMFLASSCPYSSWICSYTNTSSWMLSFMNTFNDTWVSHTAPFHVHDLFVNNSCPFNQYSPNKHSLFV